MSNAVPVLVDAPKCLGDGSQRDARCALLKTDAVRQLTEFVDRLRVERADALVRYPNAEVVETSTLQRREWTFTTSADRYGETYYLMVQARRNWAPAEIHDQDFGIAVTIAADEPRLYNQVQQRVRARERIRRRA